MEGERSTRRALPLLAAVALLAVASCATHRPPALPVTTADAIGLSPAGVAALDSSLRVFVDSGRVGGVYAVIARGGRVGYERTFGWRDVAERDRLRRDDIFRIYSMTKPVVAAGVMRLVDQGKVSLDDPVSKYLPRFAAMNVFAGGSADAPVLEAATSPITVRMLLNHTSGLPYGLTRSPADSIYARAQLYHAGRPLDEFTDYLAQLPLLFQPGTRWSYSSGLDVAGRVIEVASGLPLDRFLAEEIFRPLDMRDTGFRIRGSIRDRLVTVYVPAAGGGIEPIGEDGLMAMFEPGARFLWGSGGLLSTPDDFLRFVQMLANGGRHGETQVLSAASVASMTRNGLPAGMRAIYGGALADSTYGHGLGLAVKVDGAQHRRPGPPDIFRWSGYLGTYFWVDPANDLVAMVWTQHSPGGRYPLEARFQALVYEALGLAPAGGSPGR